MSDSTQLTATASSNTPGIQELWVSSTGPQVLKHFDGPERFDLNYDEFVGFQSNNAGIFWSRSNFNTIVLTLDKPFIVPGTDLSANELQIKIHSDCAPSTKVDANHFETKVEGVTIHFFENSPLQDTITANGTNTSTSTSPRSNISGGRMRFTTRERCSVVGPLEYVMELSRSPGDGGNSFDLQLFIPSGNPESEVIEVDVTFDKGLEAITIGPEFEEEGMIRFARLQQGDMGGEGGFHPEVQVDGTVMQLVGYSDGRLIFYSSSANPVDWCTLLVSHANAMEFLRTSPGSELDNSGSNSDSDFDFGAGAFMD
ncbi:hypothetical protein JCM24511_07862 [Saitozyma sp. JCM 24511]|nr:hypothetical protein JCM24511_07862 [Saitozyma sp. JCM 24511]